MARQLLLIVVTSLLVTTALCVLTAEEEAAVDGFMEDLVSCLGMPGASISLVRVSATLLSRSRRDVPRLALGKILMYAAVGRIFVSDTIVLRDST